jgi:hypothetical protein
VLGSRVSNLEIPPMPRTPTDMDYADVTGASALKPANPAPTAKPVPGVTRTGNSFSQTDSGPSQATRMREGVIGGNSIPISPGSMAARLRGDDTTVAGARLRGDIPVAETPPARIVRTGNSFTSAEANPIAGALDRFRGSQAAATMSGNLDAVRGALPADSPAYMAPSTSAPVATGQTPASAPAANPPTSAPRANPLTSARADRELALDTDAPGIVDKPARAQAMSAAQQYVQAVVAGYGQGATLTGLAHESETRMIGAAAGYFGARINAADLSLKALTADKQLEFEAARANQAKTVKEIDNYIAAFEMRAKVLATEATALLNNIRAGGSIGYSASA